MTKPRNKSSLSTNNGPLFSVRNVGITPAAQDHFNKLRKNPLELVWKHVFLEQGLLGDRDHQSNIKALKTGDRIFSSYQVGDEKVWIITESDRSYTTIMFPSEY
jgi:hypothetical protein